MVGLKLPDARSAWTAAGFTGTFTPAFGLNTKVVLTQSQVPGECLPAATSVTVTYGPS